MSTINPASLKLVITNRYRPRITAAQAKLQARSAGAKRIGEVDALIDELIAFGTTYGYNPDVLLGMANLETDTWRSPAWDQRLNPGGIGITDQHDFELGFATGKLAARAMAVHFMAYARGMDNRISGYIGLDPRFIEVHKAGFAGIAKSLADLGKGRWATDPDYAAKVAGRIADLAAVKVTPAPPAPVTPAQPPATGNRYISKTPPEGIVWEGSPNYHVRRAKVDNVTHHISDDNDVDNVISWLRSEKSEASSHFVIERDGTIHQLVSTDNASWTNGDVQNPRTDIPALTRAVKSGINANDFCVTIEYVGKPGVPLTDAQYEAGTRIAGYVVATRGVSPNRSGQRRHSDWNSVSRSYCPGDAFDLERIIKALGGDPANLTS